MKKQILILSLMMILLSLNAKAELLTYKCGDDCTATLDEKGVLTVTGTGEMYNFETKNRSESPFYRNNAIKKVVVEEGITQIGKNIFVSCSNIQNIELADSVQQVLTYAFDNISNIQSITMSDKTTWNSQDNFNDQEYSNTIKIYCRGDLEKCEKNLSKSQHKNFKGTKAIYKGKRIYTVNEANTVSGKKNSVMIRYK